MKKNIRLLSILEDLLVTKHVSVKALALKHNVSVKSIQNDFQVLNEYFSEKLLKQGDCYMLLDTQSMAKLFSSNPQTIKHFLYLISMIDASFYDEFINEYGHLLKGLNLHNTPIYQIINNSNENLTKENRKILEQLESFIAHRNYIRITYSHENMDTYVYHHTIPLKILYMKENWYLVALTTNDIDNNSVFKKLRIGFITDIQASRTEPKHFHSDHVEKLKAEKFLETLQSPFSDIGASKYMVTLRVSLQVARYFKSKKYLKSQRVLKELENGDILVQYEITHDMEIIPIVQQWIPFIQVVEPLFLREKIVQNIEKFMKGV